MHEELLARLLADAWEDPAPLGLIRSGSPALDDDSDLDLSWVLTDEAYRERVRSNAAVHVRQGASDILYTSPEELERLVNHPGWWTYGYAAASVLLDKNGVVTPLQQAFRSMSPGEAADRAAEAYDGYLNSFIRSLRAWQKGDELGARLQAAESLMHAARTLFALERRPVPYHDRLAQELASLDVQGWQPGYLGTVFLEIARSADPTRQQELEQRLTKLIRGRDVPEEDWGEQLERLRRRRFPTV